MAMNNDVDDDSCNKIKPNIILFYLKKNLL